MFFTIAASAESPKPAPRQITLDVSQASKPLDRFYDLSVGSDFPGTLIRSDSQAQLKTAVDELGFRYLRFHAIFHDVLPTVRTENGKTIYDWTKIDELYDDLLKRHTKPFVELGFTPNAMKTSENKIFYWHGNTSHPVPAAWSHLVDAFIRHIEQRYGQDEVRSWFFEDLPESDRVISVGSGGSCKFSLAMRSNDVVLITFQKIKESTTARVHCPTRQQRTSP